MPVQIRPFAATDLPAIVAVHAAAVPDRPRSLHELEYDATRLEETLRRHFLIAERDAQIVGVADYHRSASSYHPHKFWLELYVHPDSRRQGIGGSLYEAALREVVALEGIALRTQVSENEPFSVRFAETRGFVEDKRDFESLLDVQAFDAAPYLQLGSDLERTGISLQSWRELDSGAFRRELHAVFSRVRLDVPRGDPATPISFEFFEEHVMGDPELNPDASFAAQQSGAIVGFTGAYRGARAGWLDQWLTATVAEVRGRGVATALKVKQLEAARDQGFTMIRTDNDSRNAAMLAVNTKLGFVRQMAVLSMLKTL